MESVQSIIGWMKQVLSSACSRSFSLLAVSEDALSASEG